MIEYFQLCVVLFLYKLGQISPCYFSALFMQSPVASLFDRSQDNYKQPAVLNHLPKNIIITTLTLRSESLDQYTPPLSSDENEQRYCYWLGFIYRCEQLCMCVSSHFSIDLMFSRRIITVDYIIVLREVLYQQCSCFQKNILRQYRTKPVD